MLLCLLLFCSCSQTEEKEKTEPGVGRAELQIDISQDAADEPDAASMFRGVLSGEIDFYAAGMEKKINVTELVQTISSSIPVEIRDFTVVDLDDDGIQEVVLWLTTIGIEYYGDYGSEILHFRNGEIYGYEMSHRGFNSLKEDGTFHFSSGASDHGIGQLKFDEQTCQIEKISFCKSDYESGGVSYFVNGQETSQDAFESEMEKQNEKRDAEQYDFTDKNVEEYIR